MAGEPVSQSVCVLLKELPRKFVGDFLNGEVVLYGCRIRLLAFSKRLPLCLHVWIRHAGGQLGRFHDVNCQLTIS
jgi:hypothetical protein